MKRSTTILAASALAFSLAACAPPSTGGNTNPTPEESASDGGRTKVRILQWWANEQGWDTLNGIKAAFEEANPDVELVIEDLPYNQAHDAIVTQNLAGEAPDIIVSQAAWLVEFARAGIIAPIDDYLDDTVRSGIDPSMLTTYDGHNWGVPTARNGVAMFYNEDILKEAGVDVPTTWDEMLAAAPKIAKTGKYALTGNLASEPPSQITYEVWPLILQAGGNLLKDGKPAFNSPAGVAALEYLKKLYDGDKWVTPGALAATETQKRENFVAGNTAFMYDSPAGINIVRKGNPELKFGTAPMPAGVVSGTVMQGTQLTLAAQGKAKDKAWKFLAWVSSAEGSEKWASSLGFFPSNTQAQASSYVADNPYLLGFAKAYDQADSLEFPDPQLPNSVAMRTAFTVEVQRFMEGEKTAQQALDDAAAAWLKEMDA